MLKIEKLELTAGDFRLKSLSQTIEDGEYFVLMGPTGSGKSLLLKGICGLIPLLSGKVFISDRDVTTLQPKYRRVGYVPQNSSLFSNLTVKRNITFPLEIRKTEKHITERKVAEIAEMLKITHLLERGTHYLSGGETQKVAIARALASDPDILLLDEPVSAVDEPTRFELCSELVRIQRELKISTVHVCHSLAEAKSVSDRVGIMINGELRTTGKLDDILNSGTDDPDLRRLLILE